MAEGRKVARAAGCAARLGGLAGTVGVLGLAGLSLTVGGGLWAHQRYVVKDPGPEFDRAHIRSIIAQESPVYYRDGTTRVGVFFESEHRQFVPFDELPVAYVMAIVAAEDGTYWSHPGVSWKHVLRAFRDNLVAGDLVAGGSTLTQQTAKNLFYRPDRSLRAKLGELLNALKLEAHFEKSEILEFYANQFHVTGNGRGLGIAARHFFDKDPQDLTTLEAAFLAGLVKGPANYDPFLGDDAHRERAIARAHDRTRYVLQRMVDEPLAHLVGPPSDGSDAGDSQRERRAAKAAAVRAEAEQLLREGFELPFRHGNFRYDSSAVLDEVARRLAEPPFDEILGGAGIDDPRNAGLVVVTTLDVDAQREATWALWHHLTEVGVWLEQKAAADFVVTGAKPPRFDPDLLPAVHEFRLAQVTEKPGAPGKKTVTLDLGGAVCAVDRAGVSRVAVASERGRRKDPGAKASADAVDAWVDALPAGGVVLASVREVGADGARICDLELRPELQGAVVALEHGEVRAMVGGNDGRNFNRATALRQLGSTWKPLVYHAALSLGWSPDDRMDNTRNVFPFSSTWYYPSPDHDPAPQVSMSWAGVNSENLAAVWLLYHLTDRLDGDEVRQLAGQLDLLPRPGEGDDAYRDRIQRLGVLPTRERVAEGLFLQSKREVLAGIDTARHPDDELAVLSLLYGWGFAAERNRTGASKARPLANDFQSLRERVPGCRFQYEALARAVAEGRAPDASVVADLSVQREGDRVHVACGQVRDGFVAPDAAFVAGSWSPAEELPPAPAPGRFRPFFARDRTPTLEGPRLDEIEDLWIDDRLRLSTLEELGAAFDRRTLTADESLDLYDPEILVWHQDFRVLLAMRYLASLARDFGVQTEIREVLAMPLGASEITIEEATSLYAGLATGEGWQFPGRAEGRSVGAVPSATLLVAEIRDVDGRVLYRADGHPTAVTDPEIGGMTSDILRNVVLHGTGRRAADAVTLRSGPVPVAGKTGTTNDFRNAAFVGVVPRATPAGFSVRDGWFLGVYVGYDDNRPMTAGRIRLAGASGALPAWIGAARGLAAAGLVGTSAPAAPDLIAPASLIRVPVEAEHGLPDPAGAGSILVRADALTAGPDLSVPHLARPPRPAPTPTDRTAPPGGEAAAPRREDEQEEVLIDP